MKKHIQRVMAMILTFCLVFAGGNGILTPKAADITSVKKVVTYNMTEARKMLELVNQARKDANAEAIDGITNRSMMQLDGELEETAMLRVAEQSVYFNHVRPTGKSCFDAYPASVSYMAENLAKGQKTYTAAIKQLCDDEKEKYLKGDHSAATGHYQNIINKNLTCVGNAGCIDSSGTYYWTQSFGNKTSVKKVAENLDGIAYVEVSVSTSFLASENVTAKSDAVPAGTRSFSELLSGASSSDTANTTEGSNSSGSTNVTPTIISNKKTGFAARKPVLKSVKNTGKKKITIAIKKKVKDSTGYQIRFSTKKSMKKATKCSVNGKNISKIMVTGLKKNKKYYVQIRAVKKVKGKGCYVVYYSKWSSKKRVKIKK